MENRDQSRRLNAKTLKVLRDSERGLEVQRFNSAEELFEDLGL